MYLTIQGIVLRVTDYNDRDALLTLLTRRHGKLTARMEVLTFQSVKQSKLEIQIFAPGCEDILGKYCEVVPIEFANATNITMDVALKKYDEIWVFSDVIPFGTYRMLRKWKQVAGEKVIIFQTATELVDHVEKLMQNR